jgi:hypothetical protein
MTMEAKKVMTRGRRSKNKERGRKKNLIANRGLKSRIHWRIFYEADLPFEWQVGWIKEY